MRRWGKKRKKRKGERLKENERRLNFCRNPKLTKNIITIGSFRGERSRVIYSRAGVGQRPDIDSRRPIQLESRHCAQSFLVFRPFAQIRMVYHLHRRLQTNRGNSEKKDDRVRAENGRLECFQWKGGACDFIWNSFRCRHRYVVHSFDHPLHSHQKWLVGILSMKVGVLRLYLEFVSSSLFCRSVLHAFVHPLHSQIFIRSFVHRPFVHREWRSKSREWFVWVTLGTTLWRGAWEKTWRGIKNSPSQSLLLSKMTDIGMPRPLERDDKRRDMTAE